jgi:[ribosomal protein S18]-alanine N-acetyltransferase
LPAPYSKGINADNMSPLSILPMTEQHLEPVLAIERASFPGPWGKTAFLSELACDHSRNFILSAPASSAADTIIAYTCLRIVLDEMHLMKIAVTPASQGRGIAYRFLKECMNRAVHEEISAAFLEVRAANTAGRRLYVKLGFKPVGKRPGYYPESGEAAIIMKKTFQRRKP